MFCFYSLDSQWLDSIKEVRHSHDWEISETTPGTRLPSDRMDETGRDPTTQTRPRKKNKEWPKGQRRGKSETAGGVECVKVFNRGS
jgi:hypothetical protein